MDERADLARRVGAAHRLTGTFTLRSGKVSTTYFDKYLFEANPFVARRGGGGCHPTPPGR